MVPWTDEGLMVSDVSVVRDVRLAGHAPPLTWPLMRVGSTVVIGRGARQGAEGDQVPRARIFGAPWGATLRRDRTSPPGAA